ncbi:MAG: hypothetical protein PHR36_05275 [Patescibacteria group bacterium]|nr:hypothetical protein [Patescibacteria group bacterium]
MSKRTKIIIAILVVVLAAASRLVEHPFNFTPIVAMSIFAGCYLETRWGIILPILAMLVSDYFIGFYDFPVMASVYLAIALAFGLGWILRKYKKWYNVALASLISSLAFFFVTNFAVWAFFNWYPHTLAGLASCFTLAIPFFRNTLAGDLFYTVLFFGLFELALAWKRKEVREIEISAKIK